MFQRSAASLRTRATRSSHDNLGIVGGMPAFGPVVGVPAFMDMFVFMFGAGVGAVARAVAPCVIGDCADVGAGGGVLISATDPIPRGILGPFGSDVSPCASWS